MPLETGFKHIYLGTLSLNVLLDIGYEGSAPLFLQRNIRQALTAHQRDLASSGKHVAHRKSSKQAVDTFDMPQSRLDEWYPPPENIANTPKEPVLRIIPEAIISSSHGHPQIPSYDEQIPWLPSSNTQKLPCELHFVVQRNDEATKWPIIQQMTSPACLICRGATQKEYQIDVEMDTPLHIPLSSLLCDKSGNGVATIDQVTLKETLRELRIRINMTCKSNASRKDLHKILCADVRSDFAFDLQAPIHASVSDLSSSLVTKKLVHLEAGRVGESFTLPYELVLSMSWNKSEGSILRSFQQYKEELRAKKGSDWETDEPSLYHEITYILKGSAGQLRSVVSNDLKCQFCKDRLPHSTFDRLHLHYDLNHDHFNFRVIESRTVDGVLQRTFLLQLNEKPRLRASNDVPDEREMEWLRPTRPFDLHRYLRGDDSWTALRGHGRKQRAKSPAREASAFAPQTFAPARTRSPSEVEPLKERKRKRYPVPNLSGVELYRSVSKRLISHGELLSESDEDPEEDWAAQKQRLRRPPIMGKSRGEFFRLFDQHMHDESLCSDTHLRYAVIRFAKRYKQQLQKPLVYSDWKLKLKQLQITRLIPRQTAEWCIDHCAPGNCEDGGAAGDLNCPPNGAADYDKMEVDDSSIEPSSLEFPSAERLQAVITQWKDLPQPHLAPGAHPLTGHPRIQQLFGFAAIHSDFQSRLPEILHDAEAEREAVQRLQSIVRDRSALQVYEEDYRGWLKDLTLLEPVQVHEGTCCCGRTVCDARSLIMCAKPRCRSAGYHMACVNIEVRDPKWKCMACSGRETPWVLTAHDIEERRRQRTCGRPGLQNSQWWTDMLVDESKDATMTEE